jgi:trans-aconitate methyltransferase
MNERPAMYGKRYASAFQESGVVAAYQHRPPYPHEAIDLLAGLVVDTPARVLDVGCGTGFIARPLSARVSEVDALDVSAEMIAAGRRLHDGKDGHIHWILGAAETAPLRPPYALIVAGDSIHWLEWSVVMPRFAHMLTDHGSLAIATVGVEPPAWQQDLLPLVAR